MPITSLKVAIARGATPQEDGAFTMEAIENVGIPFFGGCVRCEASIAAYNAYPSTCGLLMCSSCIGDKGFASVEEFEQFVEASKEEHPVINTDEYDLYGD